MSKIESYRTAARTAHQRGDRVRFIAMRRAECHLLLEQAKAMPKRIRLQGPAFMLGSIPLVPTALNEARRDAIARLCARSHRLGRMDTRARGVQAEIIDRCDGFYEVCPIVAGFPRIAASPKLASRAAAEEWAHRDGYTIKVPA